jgi:hypothetical protein
MVLHLISFGVGDIQWCIQREVVAEAPCEGYTASANKMDRRLGIIPKIVHLGRCPFHLGRLKDGVSSSEIKLLVAAVKAQKRIELPTGYHSLRKFFRQAYVTCLSFSREPSLSSLVTAPADIWEPLTWPSRSIS